MSVYIRPLADVEGCRARSILAPQHNPMCELAIYSTYAIKRYCICYSFALAANELWEPSN